MVACGPAACLPPLSFPAGRAHGTEPLAEAIRAHAQKQTDDAEAATARDPTKTDCVTGDKGTVLDEMNTCTGETNIVVTVCPSVANGLVS